MQQLRSDTDPRLRRTVALLGIVLLIDGFVLGQGLISIFIALVGAILLGLGALWAAIRKRRDVSRSRLIRAAAYVALGIATMAVMRFHASTGQRQADRIIAASRAYRAEHGSYPDRLDQLVPAHLGAIPRSRYALMWNDFTYFNIGDAPHHVLMYVQVPPFGRRLYHMEQERWSTLD